MGLGDILRKARESRKLTASQVAAATHMKMQTVEAIEKEDFSTMPAAIYCKGFIKLYAEYMGLDPDPLTKEYVERFVAPPPVESEMAEEPAVFKMSSKDKDDLPPIAREIEERSNGDPDLFSYGATREEEPPEKLFDHKPEDKPKPEARPSIADGISAGIAKITNAVSGLIGKLRERNTTEKVPAIRAEPAIDQPLPNTEDPEVDTSPITLPNLQILIISGAVVGIVLLVFLISSIARFVTGDKTDITPLPDQQLVLPVEPPPPYID